MWLLSTFTEEHEKCDQNKVEYTNEELHLGVLNKPQNFQENENLCV